MNENMSKIDIIKEYKQLLDEGIITQEEFDTKKKELLNFTEQTKSDNDKNSDIYEDKNKDSNKSIAIVGMVCSGIGLIIMPILGIIGIICGFIVLNNTPKEKNDWLKAIWKYQNKARGLGMCSLIWGIIDVIYIIIRLGSL